MLRQNKEPIHVEQFLHDLFGPDLVLPEQFYGVRGEGCPLRGERALMWAVLTDGIETFWRTSQSHAERDVEEFEETRVWVQATDWDSIFSFVNLCELFGMDPTSVRSALLDSVRSREAAGRRQRFRPVTLRAA